MELKSKRSENIKSSIQKSNKHHGRKSKLSLQDKIQIAGDIGILNKPVATEAKKYHISTRTVYRILHHEK